MRFLWLVGLALLTACHSLPPLPAWKAPEGRRDAELGVIRDLRSGVLLSPEALVDRLAQASLVLVGEQHDNPDHHALELWLLQALSVRREQGSLLLEMLQPEQQARVDALKGDFAEKRAVEDLPEQLAWQKGWNWTLYGPLVRYALTQPYPMLAANLDPQELRRVYTERPPLAGRASTAPAVRKVLLAQIGASHCGMLPESQWPAMLAVQQQRDRRMAERLLAAPAPALLMAGAYHVRRDLGVPRHLQDLGRVSGVLVLLLAETGTLVASGQADFVWYTPGVAKHDYCAEMRAKKDPAEPGRDRD